MKDKYAEFREAMTKTEARNYLDGLIKKYQTVKRQNSRIIDRLSAIVSNQKHYLKHKISQRRGYDDYQRERLRLIRDFRATKKKVDRLLGRIYVDEERNDEPKYFVKMSKSKINKLFYILGDKKNATR